MRSSPCRMLALLPLLASACSSAPSPTKLAPASSSSPQLQATDYPGADALLSGFDAPATEADWCKDDQVLFALRLQKGDTVHRWLLHLQVQRGDVVMARDKDGNDWPLRMESKRSWNFTTEVDGDRQEHAMASRMLPATVRVHAANGDLLGTSSVEMPAEFLGASLLPGIDGGMTVLLRDSSATLGPADKREHLRAMVQSIIALMALLNLVQQDNVLADYFWNVVEKPSVWSVIANFGVKASLVTAFENSVPTTDLPAGMPPFDRAFVTPLRVDVNGSPALFADILATSAPRPYALCGGIVAATARHPSNPDLHFDVQLLAARLGSREPEPLRTKPSQ